MPNLLYPYLISVVATVIVLLAATWAFMVSYRRAIELARQQARLPLATRWAHLRDLIADQEKERDALLEQLQEARLTVEQAERDREWLNEHGEETARLRAERQQLVEQLERDRPQVAQLQEDLATAKQRLEDLELQAKKADFQREQSEIAARDLQQRIDEQQVRLKREDDRLTSLRADTDETEKRLIEARKVLAQSLEAAAQAEQKLKALEQEYKRLQDALSALRDEHNEARKLALELRKQREQLECKVIALQTQCSDLESRIKGLRQKDPASTTMQEGLADLWEPVIIAHEYGADARSAALEIEVLDSLVNTINAMGLHFSPRTLYAFHTSLKIARDAPLLVLAGISGTGKSLLPRRYSELMGIHFLGIPVQPRWDGPQDLLGFFNYVESRYKSTALIRALIQADEHLADHHYSHRSSKNGTWIPDEYSGFLRDHLLLVLLDEMNLARTEYYFSEFLSRLETRRDIRNPADPDERRKAELILDIGRFSGDTEPRVYVDTNVLFVGTMNEDESTLTLSDKVVDRANILRFGRPHSLRHEGSKEAVGTSTLRKNGYLSRKIWSSWIAQGESRNLSLQDQVDTWITKMNDALASVGRPFGYRTRNAIVAYVKQYPILSDHGARHAVADQIEQRILPKIRGVDPAESTGKAAIDQIKALVRDLDDRELLDAIERGCRSEGGHGFVWHGVERALES